jgi:hypothetical protein
MIDLVRMVDAGLAALVSGQALRCGEKGMT